MPCTCMPSYSQVGLYMYNLYGIQITFCNYLCPLASTTLLNSSAAPIQYHSNSYLFLLFIWKAQIHHHPQYYVLFYSILQCHGAHRHIQPDLNMRNRIVYTASKCKAVAILNVNYKPFVRVLTSSSSIS